MSKLQLSPALVVGGAGAADYATAVYGGPGQQQSVPGSNLIAAKAPTTGGSRRKRGGKIGITEVAVPIVLTTAQQVYRRRTARKGRSFRKYRKTNRRSSFRGKR
jgi:hypothetical protein